jgi:serine/threonine protein kinase
MTFSAGTRVGPYEIRAPIGSGGMGEVYHARDPRLQRSVAIKILSSSRGAGPAELDRFQREARAIARLSHPHICTLYDVGEQDGVAFLVMELLEGETLAERLERGPVPLDRALVFGIQIAEALDAAHRKSVFHRDLKPGNVMLTASGVKLLDFGLAKLRDAEYEDHAQMPTKTVPLTEQGTMLGTLPYMAPEQVEGRAADARTDIFALGVVLYQMTTGRAPFHGTSRASLTAAILTHQPPPVSSTVPETPRNLDRIAQKCLAKDPEERWQNARDLAAALRWISDDDTAHAAARPLDIRRRRRTTRVAALAAAAAIGAVTVWPLASGRLGHAASPPNARFITVTFRTGTVSAARFAPDGETIIYSAAWGGEPYALFMTRRDSVESRSLNIPDAKLLGVSSTGDLAFLRGPHDALKLLTPSSGTLVRVSIVGGGPREILDDVIAADWKPGSSDLAVVRRTQVDFPLGTKIYGSNGFTAVRIAPDGQRLAPRRGTKHRRPRPVRPENDALIRMERLHEPRVVAFRRGSVVHCQSAPE